MNLGVLTIVTAFIVTIISGYYYFIAGQNKIFGLQLGKFFYKISFCIIVFSSFYFLYLILTNSFQYDYIYRHSSRSLSLLYKISSFWAGPEGSFLLWSLFISFMGTLLLRSSRNLEPWSMFFLVLVKSFFLLLMVHKSPFEILTTTPMDGLGLNPLLQDPWMVVHPPILFLGYAAITIPFALAMSALVTKNFVFWNQLSLPWAVFASLTLGAGIVIGGFWAYEVLGWGGYWGWDPVENSSLIPWLTTIALFHGLIVQKFKNAVPKFNLVLAILSFVLVIYSTFLTRSGVLANFSVHSFQGNGQNIFLIIFMVSIILLMVLLLVKNYSSFYYVKVNMFNIKRESGLIFGMIALCSSALIVFVGTSWPIITGIFTASASSVDVSVYDKLNFPIAILMALLLGITPFLLWDTIAGQLLTKRLIISNLLTLITTISAYYFGIRQFDLILFIYASTFALWANIFTLITEVKISWLNIGGPVAHIGLSILFLGIIVSGNFNVTRKINLTQNIPANFGGYNLKFVNVEDYPNGKTKFNIDVQKDSSLFRLHPVLYFSKYNNNWMREPDIKILPLYDLYISVLERKQIPSDTHESLVMTKGEIKKFSDYEIEFLGFEFDKLNKPASFNVKANLKVKYAGLIYNLKPALIYESGQRQFLPVELPTRFENKKSVVLSDINADTKMVKLTFKGFKEIGETTEDIVLIEISIKPFMNLVWVGSILLIIGTTIAFKKRIDKKLSN